MDEYKHLVDTFERERGVTSVAAKQANEANLHRAKVVEIIPPVKKGAVTYYVLWDMEQNRHLKAVGNKTIIKNLVVGKIYDFALRLNPNPLTRQNAPYRIVETPQLVTVAPNALHTQSPSFK